MKMGMPSFRASTANPATWSECSCVMTIAFSWCGSSPTAFKRLKVSRQEIPASTKTRVRELHTSAVLPRLPLASTVRETPMCAGYLLLLWKRKNSLPSRDFWVNSSLAFGQHSKCVAEQRTGVCAYSPSKKAQHGFKNLFAGRTFRKKKICCSLQCQNQCSNNKHPPPRTPRTQNSQEHSEAHHD